MITRFAPSPTGYLHIGGVRTALFNWALARQGQGKFYLRIDDTDRVRHVEEAVNQIVDGLEWLGMTFDVPNHLKQGSAGHIGKVQKYVQQSLRGFTYQEYAAKLLADGLAYKCFCTEEEIAAEKKRQGPGYKYLGTCRDFTEVELQRLYMLRAGDYCLRLNVGKLLSPGEAHIEFNDLVLGPLSIDASEIGDPVVFRGNGVPVYNMATVIDDHEMGITHVVRGQEHITNTYIQLLIYRAIGVSFPEFAHIPVICAPATKSKPKRKISKRDGDLGFPVTLEEYRKLGYSPDALNNYLTHLGWSMDGETEKWTMEEFIDKFSLDRVMSSPACFDLAKLQWLQGEYMKSLSEKDRMALAISHVESWGINVDGSVIQTVEKIVMACGDRLNILSDFDHYRHFIDDGAFQFDLKAAEKRIRSKTEYLAAIHDLLDEWDDWTHDGLEKIVREYCQHADVKPAHIIHALRVATTGTMTGFGMFEGMEILGKSRCLQRISDALAIRFDCALQP